MRVSASHGGIPSSRCVMVVPKHHSCQCYHCLHCWQPLACIH
jgi:hypothetical protein